MIEALEDAATKLGKGAQRALAAFGELIDRAHRASDTTAVHELAGDLVEQSGYLAWLKKQDSVEADSRHDNILELLGSIQEYEMEVTEAGETPSLDDYLTRVTLVSDADTMEDVPRVPMMTIHAAKGLEFDAVFLTGLEEGLFPLRGNEPGEEDELEEERRLAYVAVTRARRDLFISHATTRLIYGQTRYNKASRFLADIPPRHQKRAATDALHDLSRGFTRGQAPAWRDIIRAGSSGQAPQMRTPEIPTPPPRAAGERYVERDEYTDDFGGDDFDASEVRVGMRVRHPRFGRGEIRNIGTGPDPAATVLFEKGPKRIKLRFLEPA